MKNKAKKKKVRILTEEQKLELQKKRKEMAFKKKIRTTFSDAGFTYFSSNNKHFHIGLRVVELDYLFVYENIIIICEDTCGKSKDKEHIRKKASQ